MYLKVFLCGKNYKFSPALINEFLEFTPCPKEKIISEKVMWKNLKNGLRQSQSNKVKIPSCIPKSTYVIILQIAALHCFPQLTQILSPKSCQTSFTKRKWIFE
ncbi:hypothetical protein DM860_011468 [Cuscuta australis]|uniref:Uncharacterized protein n=1 Tax=Cuscuta australis TaxID=267555 RepID=A0A328DUZ6_9ASTE|nr:hypothetical protein DM860_011468 [Cuscuta australis]